MKLRIELTLDNEGTVTVVGNGLFVAQAEAVMAMVGAVSSVEIEEWEDEEYEEE